MPLPRFWGKEMRGVDANEVLGMNSREKRDRAEKLVDAKEWLRSQLAAAAAPQEQLKAAAENAGFGWRTVRRAKEALGVKAHKIGFGGSWYWELPEGGHEGGKDGLQ